jgi:hypothetical protein
MRRKPNHRFVYRHRQALELRREATRSPAVRRFLDQQATAYAKAEAFVRAEIVRDVAETFGTTEPVAAPAAPVPRPTVAERRAMFVRRNYARYRGGLPRLNDVRDRVSVWLRNFKG